MRRRSAIVQHPFGTIKCRAGYRHFLVRGFNKVRGEWSLMALCYNFARVLNILGLQGFIDYLTRARAARACLLVLSCATAAIGRPTAFLVRIWAGTSQKTWTISHRFS